MSALTTPIFLDEVALSAEIESWRLAKPFRITGHTFEIIDVLVVRVEKGQLSGRGEAFGVYYNSDEPASMVKQIEAVRTTIEAGISRTSLQRLLPPGGARNAIDCAIWELEAKVTGRPVWQMAGLEMPRPLLTTVTCGADEPRKMAAIANSYVDARAIKIKLTGEPSDAERVCAVRQAREDVWLSVDANQAFTRASMDRLMPVLVESRVALIEQPFPIGQDAMLDGLQSPIPIAADESIQSSADIPGLVGRFNMVNIKLDKCGGLTEGFAMARASRELGLDTMVGSMFGTSLAMAPAFLLGQLCSVVDLDGPVLLSADRAISAHYSDGMIMCPSALWGG